MSERLRESLSALMDDQADDLELGRVLRAMEEDVEVRSVWARYHAVSAVLRGQAVGIGPASPEFRLADETSSENEPSMSPVPATSNGAAFSERRFGWPAIASFAAAAVVTLGVFLTVADDASGPAGAPTLAAGQAPLAADPARDGAATGDGVATLATQGGGPAASRAPGAFPVTTSQQVEAYMLHHAQTNAANSRAGLVPFARVAAFDGTR